MHALHPLGAPRNVPRARRWHRWFLAIIVFGFPIGAIVNIVVETTFVPSVQALLIHPGGDLNVAIGNDDTRYRARYWAVSAVHDVAFGGVVIVSDKSLISNYKYPKLADVEIRVENYDPALTAEAVASLEGLPTISEVSNLVGNTVFGPVVVVWSQEGVPVPVLRLWNYENTQYLIDDRVPMGTHP